MSATSSADIHLLNHIQISLLGEHSLLIVVILFSLACLFGSLIRSLIHLFVGLARRLFRVGLCSFFRFHHNHPLLPWMPEGTDKFSTFHRCLAQWRHFIVRSKDEPHCREDNHEPISMPAPL